MEKRDVEQLLVGLIFDLGAGYQLCISFSNMSQKCTIATNKYLFEAQLLFNVSGMSSGGSCQPQETMRCPKCARTSTCAVGFCPCFT